MVVAPAYASTWRDITGKYSVEAEFVTMAENIVRLRRADGKVIDVPLAKLSRADQQRAIALAKSSTQTASLQPTDQPSTSDLLRALKMKATANWNEEMIEIGPDGKQLPPALQLVIDLSGKPAAEAAAFGFVRITKAEASGEPLKRKKPFVESDGISDRYQKVNRDEDDFFSDHPKDRVHVKIEFENPGSATKSVTAAGSFKLRTGGQQQVVVVENAATIRGPVNHAALKSVGVKLSVEIQDGTTLQVAASGKQEFLERISVTDAQGQEPANLMGCSDMVFNGTAYYGFGFDGQIPADLQLRIHLRTGTQEVEVPFEFKNIPISSDTGMAVR